MKVGMNLFLWTDDPADPSWLPLYGRLKDMGFDGVELPIFDPDPEKFAALGRRLDDLGLERTAITICEPESDPISPDASIRRAATERLNLVVDCCEASGVQTLAGPLYAAIGQFSGGGATEEEWQRSLGVVGDVADYAVQHEIALSFEFLNRFEIYLLNTAADTARYVRDLDRPNVISHAVRERGVDGIFRDVALDAEIVVVTCLFPQPAPLFPHLVRRLPRSDDHFADPAHRLAVRGDNAKRTHIVQHVFGRNGLASNAALGKSHVLRDIGV